MAELYIHGSYAVARSIFDYLCELGARPAQAGEFTKRAFINGKLDLSEAEAVMDVINSKTALGAREALLQLKGAVNDEIRGIEDELTMRLWITRTSSRRTCFQACRKSCLIVTRGLLSLSAEGLEGDLSETARG